MRLPWPREECAHFIRKKTIFYSFLSQPWTKTRSWFRTPVMNDTHMRMINPNKSLNATMVFLVLVGSVFLPGSTAAQQQTEDLKSIDLKISFGLNDSLPTNREVQLLTDVPGMVIADPTGTDIESNDRVGATSILHYGAGDVDELVANVSWQKPTAEQRPHARHEGPYTPDGDAMWGYLMEHGSPGQAERLRQDPWNQPDAPLLTVQLNEEGTEGFSVPLELLIDQGAMWLPEQHIYLTRADQPIDFQEHLASLTGKRILDQVMEDPDATLEAFKRCWTDFGNPLVWDKYWETNYMGTTGHLTITAAAHGSIYKYAVDRWGSIRPDFASPHKFAMDIGWQDSQWQSQEIVDGLPVIVTKLEKNGQYCEYEQFAAPAISLTETSYGYIPSVMLTQVKVSGKAGPVSLGLSLNSASEDRTLEVIQVEGEWAVADTQTDSIWLLLEASDGWTVEVNSQSKGQEVLVSVSGELSGGDVKEFIVKLPSPAVAPSEASQLIAMEFASARESTVDYWEDWLEQGASFQVPEKAVNDLFRANLWHALILPRHTEGKDGDLHMELPYANTAYGQSNADWPVNQAVYVDYMLYGLRGYAEVANREIASMFETQQLPTGQIGGYANWGVYSPAHLYTIAQNYLLSGNKQRFEQLLQSSLKTLDWCLEQVATANSEENKSGLILAPLNDLTHVDREWAFTQAYFVGGLYLFGQALAAYDHHRAEEVIQVAEKMKEDVMRGFARASVKSSIVQLADRTWTNFVPTDAMTSRRMMEQWYPTDVDCGPLHLSRLGAVDPDSWLTTAMLNDHEDNLFFKNQGAANEPIYVQQSTAYLLRDEPKAAIRSFYSLMACGFSHGQLTPLEHRWAWGQYYGPPSTDGAWFELYRKMLLNEWGMDTLMIGQAVPRPWLSEGQRIEVKNAPTYFGNVTFSIDGLTSEDEIVAQVELSDRNPPQALLVRLRHPQEKPIRSVTVNGEPWEDYDVTKEYIRLPQPTELKYVITAQYR